MTHLLIGGFFIIICGLRMCYGTGSKSVNSTIVCSESKYNLNGTCSDCHDNCVSCTGPQYTIGPQGCIKCKKAVLKNNTAERCLMKTEPCPDDKQCVDNCPSDQYFDELRKECVSCHRECLGYTVPGPNNCNDCQHRKIYVLPNNSTLFNCTDLCPPSYMNSTYGQLGAYWQFMKLKIKLYYIYVLLVVYLVFASILYHCCRKRCSKSNRTARKRSPNSEPLCPSKFGPNLTRLRIIKDEELRRGMRLGLGAFGAVYKGAWIINEYEALPVAIKIPIEKSGQQAIKDFLEEAYIMASVDHPNLLSLLAVCMTSEMMFVTQLMPLGSLQDYIKANKDRIGTMELLSWSKQIALGMAYLEERRLVHRDLAARNVLLRNKSHVKITDFGMSKLLYDSDYYKAADGKMPIKWLALECIRNQIFTSKSDVWAFGVTIWELLTFGKHPYSDYLAKDVPDVIEGGYRLEQPEICTLDVYIQLVGCWNLNAALRPSFKDLVKIFSGFALDPGRYLHVPGDRHMRSPAFDNHDEFNEIFDTVSDADLYLQPKPSFLNTTDGFDTTPDCLPYCADALKMPVARNDNCNSTGRKDSGDNLDLSMVDKDCYLPTCPLQTANSYLDLIV